MLDWYDYYLSNSMCPVSIKPNLRCRTGYFYYRPSHPQAGLRTRQNFVISPPLPYLGSVVLEFGTSLLSNALVCYNGFVSGLLESCKDFIQLSAQPRFTVFQLTYFTLEFCLSSQNDDILQICAQFEHTFLISDVSVGPRCTGVLSQNNFVP